MIDINVEYGKTFNMQFNPQKLEHLSDTDLKIILKKLELEYQQKTQNDFLLFVKSVWTDFIQGKHHVKYAEKLEKVANGTLKRLIVNMPPRHTKSEFASYLFPAWFIGKNPKAKLMQTTHNAELAFRFGRKMKNLIDSPEYRKNFPDVKLAFDSKAAGRWETNRGGEYFAAGVGGAITGRGADLLIIDDPHSEQDALSESALDNAYEWYTSGPRQRLQPGGSIVIVMTRWSTKDLTERLLRNQSEPRADQWDLIEFPAILPSGKPLWPGYWQKQVLMQTKASLSEAKWQSQYQQNPTSEEGALIKREWWQRWEKEDIPDLIHIIQSYDTAYSKKESADYSAITTWGVFKPVEHEPPAMILLDAQKGRWDFPELKKVAYKQYKYWEPETTIIEAKASGMPLTHELRQIGIPVINFTPSKGNDKHTRVNACSTLFESGKIWAPKERWAEEVIEECAAFPYGDHDDYVDTVTQALMRFRQGGLLALPDDYEDEPVDHGRREYY
jgi:predicted phage terminase large subunit-like protein